MPLIEPGSGILALAAPSPRHESHAVVIPVDGSQPEVECTQEDLVSLVEKSTEDEGGHQDVCPEAPARRSSRMSNQGGTSTKVADKAAAAAKKKDLSGTSLNTSNSFAVLDDDDIIARALEMGASQCSLPLEKVHYLKDLEIARHSIKEMQGKETAVVNESDTILLLGFNEELEDDIDDFTPVVSRRTKKQRKSAEKKKGRGTPTKSGVASRGALAKSSAASVKVHNDHPLCGIVTGTRNRRKNSKYL
jgi:hypothetical protein